jgi:hypothetical protein
MLLLAGLPISPSRGERELITASAIGVVSALGILFKALEGALISLVANFLCKRSKPEVAACLVAFAVIVLLTCIMFSSSFIPLIVYRGYTGSTSPPGHSSPWILLPSETAVFYLKPLISFAALASCVFAWVKKKIDLLNLLAATLVIFVCLWITTGSMDRMNIAMIFALMCLATLSLDLWLKLAIANTLVQVATYVVGLGLFETSMRHLSFVTRWVPFSSLYHICTQFFISSR